MKQKMIEIKAYAEETKKPATVKGLAYNGGILDVGIGSGVVLDLQGLEIPDSIPLLADHKNEVGNKIGDIKAEIIDNALWIEGKITSENFLAQNIITQSKAGGKWQLSIGARMTEYEVLEEETEINGQMIAVGMIVATKSVLREVSIVAIGADKNTSLEIAAKAVVDIEGRETNKPIGENVMDEKIKENEVKDEATVDIHAALKAERDRYKAIKDVCDGDVEIENKAIEAGWSADQTAKAMLDKMRANRPAVNVNVKAEANTDKTIEAALMIRAGVDEKEIIKECGEQAIEAGYKARNISVKDAAIACIKASGQSVGLGFGNGEIKAAFTTSLPGILGNVANKRLQQAFASYSPVAFKLAQTADINDFKASEIYNIADYSNLTEVATSGNDTGKLAADKFVEHKGTNQLKTYGKIVSLTRQQIINDDLGAFLKAADILGNRCAKTIDQLFFKKLLANGAMADQSNLFSSAHNNLLDITNYALAVDKVKLAIAEFLKQTGLDGEPIGAMPKYLVVPPELYFLAKEICESTYMVGGSAKSTAMNPVAGLLEAVQSPYLSNSTYTGYSATDWYLFGNPIEVPAMEIGFLKGQSTPTIEGSDAEFDTLGYSWRVYYDIGIGVADYRGVLKAGTVPVESSSGE
ncbi:MAG: Mu-like prophage major head subunit gpT family protein [Candidatus Methanomethylophilaceae archaeon]